MILIIYKAKIFNNIIISDDQTQTLIIFAVNISLIYFTWGKLLDQSSQLYLEK